MAALIPVAVIGLALWALVQWAGAQLWHLLIAVALGVILSQLSGGHLH